jgi:hypothetical protein
VSGKAFTIWDRQSDDFPIFVTPVVTAHWQLVDEKGVHLANRTIRYLILPSVPEGAKLTKKNDYGNSGQISTDEKEKFTLANCCVLMGLVSCSVNQQLPCPCGIAPPETAYDSD